MAQRSSYEPGTLSWVDLGPPDTQAAASFYGALFGWEAAFDPRPETGGYGMFKLRGRNVAGIGPQMNPGPPYWSVYVSVSDIEAVLGRVTEGGGKAVAGPMDIFTSGRMAVIQDPRGCFISLWQPGNHIGAELVNEPGAFTWNELSATDLSGAVDFYCSVFGWEPKGDHLEQGVSFELQGQAVCGAHVAGEGEFPSWSVWFWVDDCDSSAERARQVGGNVLMGPTDMPFGRAALIADPHGAVFGIGAMASGSPGSEN